MALTALFNRSPVSALGFFDHINLIYGTVSEFCTQSTCPEMCGPGPRSVENLIDFLAALFNFQLLTDIILQGLPMGGRPGEEVARLGPAVHRLHHDLRAEDHQRRVNIPNQTGKLNSNPCSAVSCLKKVAFLGIC